MFNLTSVYYPSMGYSKHLEPRNYRVTATLVMPPWRTFPVDETVPAVHHAQAIEVVENLFRETGGGLLVEVRSELVGLASAPGSAAPRPLSEMAESEEVTS